MNVLVTGGAGYIGSHVVRSLKEFGHEVAVLDDLSTGTPDRLDPLTRLYTGSLLDKAVVSAALRSHKADAVVHIAAKKAVDESVSDPITYYEQNVAGMHSVLSAMVSNDCKNLVFSSSAAVYGDVAASPVTESSPTVPSSPYGRTKLICEQMIRDVGAAVGLNWAALRYFNVVGTAADELGDRGEHNLVPKIFRALSMGVRPKVYGDSFPTPDGTCIRDYVHVVDVAEAHVSVLESMTTRGASDIYNIGTGSGTSVLEVMSAVRMVTGINFDHEICPPRAGDPADVVADTSLIRETLGWRARHDLVSAVDSAWRAWPARPSHTDI